MLVDDRLLSLDLKLFREEDVQFDFLKKQKNMYNLVNSQSFGWKIFGRCVERGASSHSLFNPSKIGQPEAQSRR